MSGANGIYKFLRVNREEQLAPLQTIGTEFFQRIINIITASPLTAAQFIQDMTFSTLTPNLLTGPTAAALFALFSQQSNPVIGNRFAVDWVNTDLVNPKVVTLPFPDYKYPDGTGPVIITIPPNSTARVEWELSSIAPPMFTLYSLTFGLINNTASIVALPPGVVPGDLLEWNGTAWTVSSVTSITIAGILNNIRPVVAATDTINLLSRIRINANNLSSAFIQNFFPVVGDQIAFLSVPPFVGAPGGRSGYRAFNNSNVDADVTLAGLNANYRSDFAAMSSGGPNPVVALTGNPAVGFTFVLPSDPPRVATAPQETLYHYAAFSGPGGGGLGGFVYGVSVSGQVYAGSYMVLSGQDAKKNIVDASVNSESLRDLQPRHYHYKQQDDKSPKSFGLVAEEVGAVIPQAFVEGKDNNYISLPTMMTYLVGACKHMEARLSKQEAINAALEARLAALETEVHG